MTTQVKSSTCNHTGEELDLHKDTTAIYPTAGGMTTQVKSSICLMKISIIRRSCRNNDHAGEVLEVESPYVGE